MIGSFGYLDGQKMARSGLLGAGAINAVQITQAAHGQAAEAAKLRLQREVAAERKRRKQQRAKAAVERAKIQQGLAVSRRPYTQAPPRGEYSFKPAAGPQAVPLPGSPEVMAAADIEDAAEAAGETEWATTSSAPSMLLPVAVLAAVGGAVWWFYFRKKGG